MLGQLVADYKKTALMKILIVAAYLNPEHNPMTRVRLYFVI